MNIVSYKPGSVMMPIEIPVRLGDKIYSGLVAVFRLLNSEELKRIDKVVINVDDDEDTVYEEIFALCFMDLLGHKYDGQIDLGEFPAGVIDSIGRAIYSMSIGHVANLPKYIETYMQSIASVDILSAVVARFMNMSFEEVKALPINRLMEYYAICAKAFPQEVMTPKEEEEGTGGQ